MTSTPIHGFRFVSENETEASKVVTINENVLRNEALIKRQVISRSTTAPPGSPNEGDVYIIPDAASSPAPSGAWAGHANEITIFYNGWLFALPVQGAQFWVQDAAQYVHYDEASSPLSWALSPVVGPAAPQPTRTSLSLSGASISQAIPAGCTFFRFISGPLTLTDGSSDLVAELWHTGDTVRRDWDVLADIYQAAASVFITTDTDFADSANESSATTRGLSAKVWSPRDAAKKTLAEGRGYNATANVARHRDAIAQAATDDDTIRFVVSAGTITGDVEIEWYYG